MTTAPNKPAIYYAAFHRMPILNGPDFMQRSGFFRMKVTSFSRLHNGTRMAHGQDMESGGSVHKKADDLLYFQTEARMNEAIKAASRIEPKLVAAAHAAIEASAAAQRAMRIDLGAELAKFRIVPLEL